MSINVFDIVLIIAFIGVVGLGFLGGVIRLAFVLLSLYLGVVVATYFYVPVGSAMSNTVAALSPFTASMVAFFVLMLAATSALTVSLFKTFRTLRLPRRLGSLDQIGGSALGVLSATFAIVVAVVVLSFFFGLVRSAADAGVMVSPPLLFLAGQLRLSFLARYFVELGEPLFALMLPWFPNGLPVILTATL